MTDTIVNPLTVDQATALLGSAVGSADGELYAVEDRRGYELSLIHI